MLPRTLLALLVLTTLAFAGCDTTDPVPPADPVDVAGTYDFTQFRFNPQPDFVPDVSVLDTLNLDRTSIELLDSGQFQFRYRLNGGLDNIINGTFTLNRDQVTLRFETGLEARLRALLLDPTLTFQRTDADRLTLSLSKTVNLEAYSDEYQGTGLDLTAVPGLLEIELRRDDSGS